MRKMGQMRIPWNVYENTRVSRSIPGMSMTEKELSQRSWSFITRTDCPVVFHDGLQTADCPSKAFSS